MRHGEQDDPYLPKRKACGYEGKGYGEGNVPHNYEGEREDDLCNKAEHHPSTTFLGKFKSLYTS